MWEDPHRTLLDRLGEADQIEWERAFLDSVSVAAKGGKKTGANPTDKGKAGWKLHIVSDRGGAPLTVVLTATNVHDSKAVDAITVVCSV